MTDQKFSASQLVLIHNAVTTGAQVKKFESQGKAMARTLHALGANSLTLEQGARLAGLLPAETVPAPYDPATLHQAVNLVNGETVSVAKLHGPTRAVEGDAPMLIKNVFSSADSIGTIAWSCLSSPYTRAALASTTQM